MCRGYRGCSGLLSAARDECAVVCFEHHRGVGARSAEIENAHDAIDAQLLQLPIDRSAAADHAIELGDEHQILRLWSLRRELSAEKEQR